MAVALAAERRRHRNPLADHWVKLDPASDEVRALGDLYGYARSYSAPDRRVADETRIVSWLGAWAGRTLLGEKVGAAIVAAAPVTVRVVVPDNIGQVQSWPLELAHVDGRPLAARGDVSLVYGVVAGRASQRANRLAAALVFHLASMRHEYTTALRALAANMGIDDGAEPLPSTLAEVVDVTEQTDGVRFGELVAALAPNSQTAEEALAEILTAAAALASEQVNEPDMD
jgi:hypothetical protein